MAPGACGFQTRPWRPASSRARVERTLARGEVDRPPPARFACELFSAFARDLLEVSASVGRRSDWTASRLRLMAERFLDAVLKHLYFSYSSSVPPPPKLLPGGREVQQFSEV